MTAGAGISAASSKSMLTPTLMSRKQYESVVQSTARMNLWVGAVRSGKTFSSLIAWLLYVLDGPSGELLMWGRTERTLKRNILDPIAELLDESDFRLVSGAGECWIFGRRVYLAGANDERSEGKIRGLTLAGAYGDELTLTPESFMTMLLSRLSVPGARLFGTTNTDSPAHWLKKKFIDRAGELDLRHYRFGLSDNPSLDPAYVEALKREYTGLWYARYIEGQWALAEGAIFDMFDTRRHVVTRLPRMARTWLGVDYGTSNAFVALLIGLGVDDCLYVIDEYRWDSRAKGRQLTDAEYSAAVRKWLQAKHSGLPWPTRLYYDPSAASFGVQLWRDKWHGITPADNAVLDGIRTVSTLFAVDRLKVHRRCEGLLEELPGYRWDPKSQLKGEDKPVKVDDHGPDALRYPIMGLRGVWKNWIRNERAAA